jgi:hypothetical protein
VPPVAELVRLGLNIAPVVVLGLPHNAVAPQIGELAGGGNRARAVY